jgi:hypothetical protein
VLTCTRKEVSVQNIVLPMPDPDEVFELANDVDGLPDMLKPVKGF